MPTPLARKPASAGPAHLNRPGGNQAREVPQATDSAGGSAWKLALMAVAVLAAMAAITATLVYVGPLIGL
jgi:hypothetical protein